MTSAREELESSPHRKSWWRYAISWVRVLAFLVTISLWVVSYVVPVTVSIPTSTTLPAPATIQNQNTSVTIVLYRHFKLEAGSVLLGYPMWFPNMLGLPLFYLGKFEFGADAVQHSNWPKYAQSSLPMFSGGYFVLPLWLPAVIFGVPTIISFWRGRQRRRRERASLYAVVRVRFGPMLSAVLALVVFFATLWTMPSVLKWIDYLFWPGKIEQYFRWQLGFSDTFFQILILFVAVTISIVIAQIAFRFLRWRTCYEDRPRCLSCAYELTGNVSGICPECGTAIQDRVTPTPSA